MTLEQNRIICPQIHLMKRNFPRIQSEENRGEREKEKEKRKAIFKFKFHF